MLEYYLDGFIEKILVAPFVRDREQFVAPKPSYNATHEQTTRRFTNLEAARRFIRSASDILTPGVDF